MDNKKEDKYLEPVRDDFFSKIANFFKSIFQRKKMNNTEIFLIKEETFTQSTKEIETENQVQEINQNQANGEEKNENSYVDIKAKVAEIQKRYETEGYDLTLLTSEEYEELKLLYQEQITMLNRRYENRVRELKSVRTKIQKLKMNG